MARHLSISKMILSSTIILLSSSAAAMADAKQEAKIDKKALSSSYHQLHENPELGKEEVKTAEFIRSKLKEYGYRDLLSVTAAPTTVIAILDTGKSGTCICFRSEMDARKCTEKTNLPFASKSVGLMHNCGHDAHAAILLETAHQLMLQKDSLKGKYVLLFQPAEECAGGADEIVNDGILKRLGVAAIFAQHSSPNLPVGFFNYSAGPVLAGSNNFTVKLSGLGGHAAQPHERDDLSSLAALLTLELERLPSRVADVIRFPTVCAVTNNSFSSTQANVAADAVTLGGTIRAFYSMDEKLFRGKSFKELASQLVSGLSSAYGVNSELDIRASAPVTVNDASIFKEISPALSAAGLKIEAQERGMFAEDFSYYTNSIPSAYFGLGISRDGRGSNMVHSAQFNIHEDCLEYGVRLFMVLAEKYSHLDLQAPDKP